MSLWDIGSGTIGYFCGDLQIPIHIAVTPYGNQDLSGENVRYALNNINAIKNAQEQHLRGGHLMIVKIDDPTLLKNIVQQQYEDVYQDKRKIFSAEEFLRNPVIFSIEKSQGVVQIEERKIPDISSNILVNPNDDYKKIRDMESKLIIHTV